VGELPFSLCRRALEFLKAAEGALRSGLFNAAGLLAQIAAELAVKATIVFLGYSFPETHQVRKLLAHLAAVWRGEEVTNFIKSRRGELIVLENARQRGQYFSYGIEREDAEICLSTAREVIELVKRAWGDKWCGV
jgi:HEPN domain-containing protein